VEAPRTLYGLRYNHLRADHEVGMEAEPSPDTGRTRRMDICFAGGEVIRLRDDWRVEVRHVPGHPHGHLALSDPVHKAAFVGDAIHGRGCLFAAGGMAIPVTYSYVDIYLSTLRYVEHLLKLRWYQSATLLHCFSEPDSVACSTEARGQAANRRVVRGATEGQRTLGLLARPGQVGE
jgi:glyoxylase-like metal-dependent hydrolase (beta-lactamase superfamily II)